MLSFKEQLEEAEKVIKYYADGLGQYDTELWQPKRTGGAAISNLHGVKAREYFKNKELKMKTD